MCRILRSRRRLLLFLFVPIVLTAALRPVQAGAGEVGFRLKLAGGRGFLSNGGGDLETTRVETQAWLSSHLSPWKGTFDWEGLSTVPDWKAEFILTFGRHFGLGLGLGRTALTSRGDFAADFYWYESRWWAIELENSNSFSQSYKASALGFQLNLYYFLPLGRFELYAFAGPGLYFGKFSHDYKDSIFFRSSSIYFWPPDKQTEEFQANTQTSERASCTRLGFQGGVGVEFRVSPHVFFGFESLIRRVNFDDWRGTFDSSFQSTDKFFNTSQGWWKTVTDSGTAWGEGELWSHSVVIDGAFMDKLPVLSISEGTPEGDLYNPVHKAEINFHAIDILLTLSFRF